MDEWKAAAVFIVGLVVILAAVIGFLFLRDKTTGRIKIGENEISGSGAVVFLGVGAVLVLAGMGWNGTTSIKNEAIQQVADLNRTILSLQFDPVSGVIRTTPQTREYLRSYQLPNRLQTEIHRLPPLP